MDWASVLRRGQGPPAVLLPGAGADASLWSPLADRLDARFSLHLVEVGGFAGRPAPDGPLWPALADELERYIATLDEEPILVGHSWGSFVAWSLVARGLPVRATVCIDSMPALGELLVPGLEGIEPTARLRSQRLAQAEPDGLRALLAPSIRSMTTSLDQARCVLDLAARSEPRVLAEAMYVAWTTDLRPSLARSDVPTLLVLAEDAQLAPPDRELKHGLARRQIAVSPRHRVVVVPTAAHYVMIDRPARLADIITEGV